MPSAFVTSGIAALAWCALARPAASDTGSSLDAAPAAASSGEPIDFDVSISALTTVPLDAFRYEAFIDELLVSPLSQWEALEDPGAPDLALFARPIEVDGVPFSVVRFDTTYPVSGGRALFDFLTSLEATTVVNGPNTADSAETRANAGTYLAPGGVEGRITALPNSVRPSAGGLRVITGAQFEARCSPFEQTFYNFPAVIPFEDRPADVQALGEDIDIAILFGYRISDADTDDDSVDFTGVLYFPLLPGPPSVFVSSAFWVGFDARLTEVLADSAGRFVDDEFDLEMCLKQELALDLGGGSMGGYGH